MNRFYYSAAVLALLIFAPSTGLSQKSDSERLRKEQAPLVRTEADSVRFGKVEALSDGNGVLLRWETEYERDNLGFEVYRVSGKDLVPVSPGLIPGNYLKAGNNSRHGDLYRHFDPKGNFNSAYIVRSRGLDGSTRTTSLIRPRYQSSFGDGISPAAYREAAMHSRPVTVEKSPILPESLKNEVASVDSLSDFNTQRWVAAQPGMKIGIKAEGLYRVTFAELQTAGFDTSTDPANWQLYYKGIEQAIKIVDGQHIEFYGRSIDTVDTDINTYFLINGPQPGKRMFDTYRRGIGGFVLGRNYDYSQKHIYRFNFGSSILNGERENWFGSIIGSSSPTTLNIHLDGIDQTRGKSRMFVELQGLTNVAHQVQITVNGRVLERVRWNNKTLAQGTVDVPTSMLQEGNNTVQFQALNGSSDFSVISTVRFDYSRLYQAQNNTLKFYTNNLKLTRVTGFASPDVRVFDITYPDSPRLIINATVDEANKQGTEYRVSLPAHRTRQMLAVEDSTIRQAHSIVQNNPSTLADESNQADLIIITNRAWLTEAEAWAAYRQNEGMTVFVADVEDAYDEFDFGRKGAKAIREFLRHTWLNWQAAPDYVLILGDASFDPKNYGGNGFHSYVPIRFVDTLYEETGSDEAMADFDDDGLSEIAIGRIPVRTAQEVTNVFNKVVNFESDVSDAHPRGSLCASDDPIGYDFAQLCMSVQSRLPGTIPTSHINRSDPDARANLLSSMSAGKYLVNYSGHGAVSFWAANGFFNSTDAVALNNQNDLSIFTMLTCLNGYFIDPTNPSLSERLLLSTNGGAVAAWASAGSTTPDVQQVMATRFFDQLGNNPALVRMGDLVKDAKANLVGGADVRRSWALLGDPTLKVK